MTELVDFEDPEAVFEIEYSCKNCGSSWIGRYRSKTSVHQQGDRVYVRDTSHDHFGINSCSYCRLIECPTCELRRHVFIADRRPYEHS